jgi:hypothetical protein
VGYIYVVAAAEARTDRHSLVEERVIRTQLRRIGRDQRGREEREEMGTERRSVVYDAEGGDDHERQGTYVITEIMNCIEARSINCFCPGFPLHLHAPSIGLRTIDRFDVM